MNRIILSVIILIGASTIAHSQSFLNAEAIKSQSDLWLQSSKDVNTVEFVNDGSVVSLQFEVAIGGLDESQVSCQQNFSSNHVMACFFKDDYLKAAVYSITNAAVPDTTLLTIDSAKVNSSYLRRDKSDSKQPVIRAIKFNNVTAANVTPDHLK